MKTLKKYGNDAVFLVGFILMEWGLWRVSAPWAIVAAGAMIMAMGIARAVRK